MGKSKENKTNNQQKVEIKSISEDFIGARIPLSGYREARIAIPKFVGPHDVNVISRLVDILLNDGSEEEKKKADLLYKEAELEYLPTIMYLTGVNIEDIGTERDIKLSAHLLDMGYDEYAFISYPNDMSQEEKSQIKDGIGQIGKNFTNKV